MLYHIDTVIKVFCLTAGRTGTKYLSDLFKNNIRDCVSKHEPAPTMFGKPIYWYYKKQNDKIEELFKKKLEKINSLNARVYVETNHAFLKSFSDVSMKYFPDMKLIHPIRNPLNVAKSNFNKYEQLRKIFYPLNYKSDDGKKYIKWTLTGNENIYKSFNFDNETIYKVSDRKKIYQYFLLEWIETENRAMQFLDKYKKHNDCFTLDVPKDLNNRKKLKQMFKFFDLELKNDEISFRGRKNKGGKKTVVIEKDKKLLDEIVTNLPGKYLKIFQNKPYVDFEWGKMLYST